MAAEKKKPIHHFVVGKAAPAHADILSDTPYTPYYYGNEKATFEQDFLIQKAKSIVPIEVKAEQNIRSHSLKTYCEKFQPEEAVRFSTLKYKEQERMVNIPLYAVCNL